MKKILLASMSIALIQTAHAQTIQYSTIESPKQFQRYWELEKDEMETYQNYMANAGRFRHTDSNPLVVLSMLADDKEDKAYYAKRAAQYEAQMQQREIETAWLISQAMDDPNISDAMQRFSDNLTGIDTMSYQPKQAKAQWQEGDSLVIVIDDICKSGACLVQFQPLIDELPIDISVAVVLKGDKALNEISKASLSPPVGHTEAINYRRYDPIEHHYLEDYNNQALHIRNHQVVRIVTGDNS